MNTPSPCDSCVFCSYFYAFTNVPAVCVKDLEMKPDCESYVKWGEDNEMSEV